ncbi:MAG TPA: suppressor of fused domain protein, partial [Thermoanaerobaculia bacterium]|nr:suppressor of fused domain protein [Thermoanaerobaculia bacterium]
SAFLAPMHTLSAPKPLTPSSEMVGFCFAIPPGVDVAALTRATITADLVLQVVPISKPERELAEKEGAEALLDAFDRSGVPPYFELGRRSVV